MLAADAFGNFRTLLGDVTLHPIMGAYLNMLGNVKATSPNFNAPNENYAREVLQLFSIGLNQLQPDGTLKLDINGLPVPCYDQTTIQAFAQVFTGWNVNGTPVVIPTLTNLNNVPTVVNVNSYYNKPMVVNANNHSALQKTLLSGYTIAATSSQTSTTATAELNVALDNIFNHPNVGPFICRELIQRLVCSNPSPAYVYRVASVFADDGSANHVRGNLQAVVQAILTDYEARTTALQGTIGYGHLKEPILRASATIRAFHPTSTSGYFKLSTTSTAFGQTPYKATSVFNFFTPDYVQPGVIASAGLVAPELQLSNEANNVTFINTVDSAIYGSWPGGDVKIDLTNEQNMAGNPTNLVDSLNVLLMNNAMPQPMHDNIISYLNTLPANTNSDFLARARAAVDLVTTSAQFATEK